MSGSRSLNLGAEHCNRVVTSTRGVELITVGAYCYRMDNKKPVNTSKAVPLDIHEDKSAAGWVPAEHRHGVRSIQRFGTQL